MSVRRLCFALDLRDDPEAIAAYKVWHAPGGPPAAVNASIRAAGIQALEIYLTGDRLFMIMEVDGTFSAQAKAASDAADPEVQAWETLMWSFQKPCLGRRPARSGSPVSGSTRWPSSPEESSVTGALTSNALRGLDI
jgi:L-rhamnose mutarotase